jgi:cation diffusion facilitator family transporter
MTMSKSASHVHEHVYLGAAHDANARRTLWVVLLTTVMMVAEICAGYLSGSMALLADGFHMATHAGALAIAALAYRFAKRHSRNDKFSFGTGKVGDLAGFASALILAIIAIGIAIESAVRIVTPGEIAFNEAIYVAVIGLAINLVSALMLSGLSFGHHHHHHAHDDAPHAHAHDNNLRSAYIHVLADALTSILAILALLAGKYYGLLWLDPAIGIIGAVVIARWSYSLMQDTARILLDTTDAGVAAHIRNILDALPGATLTDLHVWRIGPQARAAIISMTAPLQITEQQVRKHLAGIDDLAHLTIEMHR